eukprot:2429087-Rhodomonas_salina.2
MDNDDVVYKVKRLLPSSALALHLTLTKWFKEQGFVTAGFEDSVWVCKAGGKFGHQMIVRAHIDDRLMACDSLNTLQAFKREFLMHFEGTD